MIGQLTAKVELDHARANDDIAQENLSIRVLVSRDPAGDPYNQPSGRFRIVHFRIALLRIVIFRFVVFRVDIVRINPF